MGLDLIGLPQHLIIGHISQFKGFPIGMAVLNRKDTRFDEVFTKGSQHSRMLAPGEIQRQEQSRGSVEESVIRPVDGDAVKVAIKVVLCAPQCITRTIEVDKYGFLVDRF